MDQVRVRTLTCAQLTGLVFRTSFFSEQMMAYRILLTCKYRFRTMARKCVPCPIYLSKCLCSSFKTCTYCTCVPGYYCMCLHATTNRFGLNFVLYDNRLASIFHVRVALDGNPFYFLFFYSATVAYKILLI